MSASASRSLEPSMEEILASIRRIIADDAGRSEEVPEPFRAVAPEAEAGEGELRDGGNVTRLAPETSRRKGAEPRRAREPERHPAAEAEAPSEAAPEPRGPAPRDAIPQPAEEPRTPPRAEAPRGPAAQQGAPAPSWEAPRPEPSGFRPAPRLPAPEGAPLLSGETGALVGRAFDDLAGALGAGGGRTVEDLVAGMLRPMLKEWLDRNLPNLVERLVRAEIERVARGGR